LACRHRGRRRDKRQAEQTFDRVPGVEGHDLERLRRSLAMLPPNAVASSLKREDAMTLITELVAVQARLERLRADLRRLVDETDAPNA
jgi:hypothetical protein